MQLPAITETEEKDDLSDGVQSLSSNDQLKTEYPEPTPTPTPIYSQGENGINGGKLTRRDSVDRLNSRRCSDTLSRTSSLRKKYFKRALSADANYFRQKMDLSLLTSPTSSLRASKSLCPLSEEQVVFPSNCLRDRSSSIVSKIEETDLDDHSRSNNSAERFDEVKRRSSLPCANHAENKWKKAYRRLSTDTIGLSPYDNPLARINNNRKYIPSSMSSVFREDVVNQQLGQSLEWRNEVASLHADVSLLLGRVQQISNDMSMLLRQQNSMQSQINRTLVSAGQSLMHNPCHGSPSAAANRGCYPNENSHGSAFKNSSDSSPLYSNNHPNNDTKVVTFDLPPKIRATSEENRSPTTMRRSVMKKRGNQETSFCEPSYASAESWQGPPTTTSGPKKNSVLRKLTLKDP